jgi:hypothetical protein
VLVTSFGDPAAADYAVYACCLERRNVAVVADRGVRRLVEVPARVYSLDDVSRGALQTAAERGRFAALILFLNPRLTERDRRALDDLLGLAHKWQTEFIGVVSTFRAHLGDQGAAEGEAYVLARTKGLRARTVVFRPGHVLSRNSRASARLRRLGTSG